MEGVLGATPNLKRSTRMPTPLRCVGIGQLCVELSRCAEYGRVPIMKSMPKLRRSHNRSRSLGSDGFKRPVLRRTWRVRRAMVEKFPWPESGLV